MLFVMSRFVVKLEGSGLLIDPATREQLGLGSTIRTLGFFTTRVVDAADVDRAIAAAIAHALAELRSGPLLNGAAIDSSGMPEVKATSVRRVSRWRPANSPTKGFTFYPEEGVTH